jgi:hypothetical protein
MRVPRPLLVAGLFLGLANPAIAQADPHHPEGGDTPSAVVAAPAGDAAQLAASPAGTATTQCPDMMGMMQQGGGSAMPMMHMHMMAMMHMHMQLMQQMQGGMGGMMRPDAGSSPQMQMMEMMRSIQIMQMGMMQMMQQMQMNMAAPEAADEGAMP